MNLLNYSITKYVLALLLPAILVYVLTPLAARLGKAVGLMDVPGERRIHTQPTPRSGGLAVMLAFFATLGVMLPYPELQHYREGFFNTWLLTVGPPALILLVIGLIDDGIGMNPWTKFAGQIAAVVTAWILGVQVGGLGGLDIPRWLDFFLSVGFMLAAINAFNLIDGMDGLAAGLAAIGGLGLAGYLILIGKPIDSLPALVLSGACLGFLRYNFNPASIFLGDTGSMFIGYTLAAIAIQTSSETAAVATMGLPFLVFGVPFIDTLLAIWRRSVRKTLAPGSARLFGGDEDHLHHRLARRGLTQRRVALTLYAASASVILIGLLSITLQSYRTVLFLVAFLAAAYVVLTQFARSELAESGKMIVIKLRSPPRFFRYGACIPYVDALVLLFTLGICWMALRFLQLVDLPLPQFLVREAPVLAGLPFLVLVVFRNYRVVWTRSRALDFLLTAVLLLAALLLAGAISAVGSIDPVAYLITITTLSISIVIPALLTFRALPRLIQDYTHWIHSRHNQHGDYDNRVLIYGAGYAYTLLIRSEGYDAYKRQMKESTIIGLVDESPNLWGRTVFGHPVLGGSGDLEQIVTKNRVTRILITVQDPSPDRLSFLKSFTSQHGLELHQWRLETKDLSA